MFIIFDYRSLIFLAFNRANSSTLIHIRLMHINALFNARSNVFYVFDEKKILLMNKRMELLAKHFFSVTLLK